MDTAFLTLLLKNQPLWAAQYRQQEKQRRQEQQLYYRLNSPQWKKNAKERLKKYMNISTLV